MLFPANQPPLPVIPLVALLTILTNTVLKKYPSAMELHRKQVEMALRPLGASE